MKPTSTYRLQLHAGFGFDDAAAIADYLALLGVSHVYSSPYLQAAPGSTHGYDVVDPSRVNDELGGPEAHRHFCLTLGVNNLGQVLDIVPNHMAIGGDHNRWWWDVLKNGPESEYAGFFDIDWHSPEEHLRNKILLPVLGDHYGRVLKAGELKLELHDGEAIVRYFDNIFPFAGASGFSAEELQRISQNQEDLHSLLENQHYRLSYWRAAQRDLGYRRFFDINTLVGLRMEDPRVFAATHHLVIEWLREGILDGVRVDHPDGLRDPAAYFGALHRSAPDAYIVAEKILEPGEQLPSWPIAGTSGYDFLNILAGLYVDSRNEEAMTRFYTEFTGESPDFKAVSHDKRLLVLRDLLGSDVNRLTALFLDICEGRREFRDYSRHDIHHVIRELAACFPVYRTYVQAEFERVADNDILHLNQAITCAKANRPDLDPELLDFMQSVLLLRASGSLESEFAMRFQQFTGPAMAKGVEDTAFYSYNRLVSLNEVGGDPSRFGVAPEEFHNFCLHMQQHWPDTMLATSTHDTKRGEDVRGRLGLLSEIPEAWAHEVRYWANQNEKYRTNGLPDRNTEYLIYQTMLGAWPISLDRLQSYLEKAVRESKVHTTWSTPNESYEAALKAFLEGILSDSGFLNDFEMFLQPLIEAGWITGLSQTLLKLTAPGVPDIYQGTELWGLSLVDPDNRRPVDYMLRRALLSELENLSPEEIWNRAEEGLPKLWTVQQALRQRKHFGDYAPIQVHGKKAQHAIAYYRGDRVSVVAPRLVMGIDREWADTCITLAQNRWCNVLTREYLEGGNMALSTLLKRFPVALLVHGGHREDEKI